MKDLNDQGTVDFVDEFNNDRLNAHFSLLLQLSINKLGHADIRVLSCLANDMMMNSRGYAELEQEDIAGKIGMTQSNVSRSVKRLRDQKYIEVIGKKYRFKF